MKAPKNYAIIENGIVSNVIWICPEQAGEFGAIPISSDAGIGWRYENGEFIQPDIQAESAPEE